LALALLVALALLAYSVHLGAWRAADLSVLQFIALATPCQARQAGWAVSPLLSAEASVVLASLVTAGYWWRTRRWAAAWLLAGLVATAPVELAAKHLAEQPVPRRVAEVSRLERPECGREQYPLTIVSTPFSFPSGSTARLSYFTTLGLYAARAAGRWAPAAQGALLLGAVLVAGTRLPILWHWPTDLAGGALLGAATACGALWALQRRRGA
jgi:membrane-associated phospholipid phosphatase